MKCSYDLKGLTPDGPCPECGEPIGLTVPACPRCMHTDGVPMALERRDGGAVEPWMCHRCGGIAFDRDQLRAAVQHMQGNPPVRLVPGAHDLVAQSAVPCTRCRGSMDSIVIDSRTLIDRCVACGLIWVDVGELAAVLTFMRQNLGYAPPPPELEEILNNPAAIRAAAYGKPGVAETLNDALWWLISLFWLS